MGILDSQVFNIHMILGIQHIGIQDIAIFSIHMNFGFWHSHEFWYSAHGHSRYWDIIHTSVKKLATICLTYSNLFCLAVVSMMHVSVQNATVLFHIRVCTLKFIPKFCDSGHASFLNLFLITQSFVMGGSFLLHTEWNLRKLINWRDYREGNLFI